MARTRTLLPLALAALALALALALPAAAEPKAPSPTAELRGVLSHARENVAEVQQDANHDYREVKAACESAVEELMDEVRPVQQSLISTAALMRDRRAKMAANREAVKELNQTIDLLGGQVETLGLRMAAAVREHREASHLTTHKMDDTRQLIRSVQSLMSSVSNAHLRLNASLEKPALLETAAEPTPVGGAAAATGAAPRDPMQTVAGSFKLLNLLRHELSEYAVQLPRHEAEAQVSFERVYAHLNESYHHARAQYRSAVHHRREAVEENRYLREWLARTRATLPEMRRRLRVLQRELKQEVRECEQARRHFKWSSGDRRRELETLTTVERLVTEHLTDADFLPPPPSPAPSANSTQPVAPKPDPDLNRPANNTDAQAPKAPKKESTEKNIIYG